MAEYIEREAAIEAVNLRCAESGHPTMFNIKNPLLSIPAADVIPMRHGRWMEHKSWAKCSECGYLLGFETQYCPNCGARMDGDGE